jgi:hypothetical protein
MIWSTVDEERVRYAVGIFTSAKAAATALASRGQSP